MSFAARRLYFLRHGRADRSAYSGGDDRLRPLTAAGISRLEATADRLAQLDLGCEAILTSPLVRCRQTADIMAEHLGLADALEEVAEMAPGFDLVDLALVLEEHHQYRTLLLVGHEPDFSAIVRRLTGGTEVVLKKGGLARVDLYRGLSGLAGELTWLLPPRDLAL